MEPVSGREVAILAVRTLIILALMIGGFVLALAYAYSNGSRAQ